MYAPRVFVSMLATLLAFAVASYFISGSFYTAVTQTIICAVLLQAGYFIGILYLVRRERARRQEANRDVTVLKRAGDDRRHDDLRAEPTANLKISDS